MKITGPELLKIARAGRPSVEYRLEIGGASIAAKVDGEWHRVAGKTIFGDEWLEMHECLVNGKRLPFDPDMSI